MGVRAKRAGQDIAVRVARCFVHREPPGGEALLHPGMVCGQTDGATAADQIGAAVTDVDDMSAARYNRHGHAGRAHPLTAGRAGGDANRLIRREERPAKLGSRSEPGLTEVAILNGLHGRLRGDVAGRMAAHAVRHDKQPAAFRAQRVVFRHVCATPVLVALTHKAGMEHQRVVEGQFQHAGTDGARYDSAYNGRGPARLAV